MDHSLTEKLKIEFLPSLFLSILIASFHALAHFVVGDPKYFDLAGVSEAGITVLIISFSVIYYYNVIGWRINEKLIKGVKKRF